jgi:hypothetical protein
MCSPSSQARHEPLPQLATVGQPVLGVEEIAALAAAEAHVAADATRVGRYRRRRRAAGGV